MPSGISLHLSSWRSRLAAGFRAPSMTPTEPCWHKQCSCQRFDVVKEPLCRRARLHHPPRWVRFNAVNGACTKYFCPRFETNQQGQFIHGACVGVDIVLSLPARCTAMNATITPPSLQDAQAATYLLVETSVVKSLPTSI